MPKTVKIAILLTLLVSLFGVITLTKSKSSPKQEIQEQQPLQCANCNVILISIDTLRADRLGIYGYEKETSPNINQFFKDGLIFENAYSQAPWTLPSYASLLTSQYPSNIFTELPTDTLSEKFLTLPEVLKNNGYYTAAIEGGEFVKEAWGFGQGFDEFIEIDKWQDAEKVVEDTKNFLGTNKDKKFFLFLRPFQVHDPYAPPSPWDKKFAADYKGNIDPKDNTIMVKYNLGEVKLSEEDLNYIVSQYDGEIAYVDSLFEQLFENIKQLGLDRNTIIIITADHGEEFGERGLWGMHIYSLYDELVKVPLLIKTPNKNVSGRIKTNVSLLDLSPTILEILNIQPQTQFVGRPLLNSIKNPQAEEAVFAQTQIDKKTMLASIKTSYENFIKTGAIGLEPKLREEKLQMPKSTMVRLKEWKLIRNFDGSFELYNLKDDPSEKHNQIGTGFEIENVLKEKLANF